MKSKRSTYLEEEVDVLENKNAVVTFFVGGHFEVVHFPVRWLDCSGYLSEESTNLLNPI